MTISVDIHNEIPAIDLDAMKSADGYVMEDNDLRAAANAALTLGKPLLLTGESGVGKSEFSSWLANETGLGQKLKFVVKSTTDARELFYHYDALARFHEAQVASNVDGQGSTTRSNVDPRRYISYNALGKAILFAIGRTESESLGLVSPAMGDLFDEMPDHPRRSVVLIDEIDKAPRDVPNDILDEIDNLCFTVRELGNRTAQAPIDRRPVVVITSNSERDLPKPFLRRCVYYHMGFPTDDALQRIVEKRIGQRFANTNGQLSESLRLFRYLREDAALRQPPGLAELLDWLNCLSTSKATSEQDILNHAHVIAKTKATLLKDRHDQERVGQDWQSWLDAAQHGDSQGGVR